MRRTEPCEVRALLTVAASDIWFAGEGSFDDIAGINDAYHVQGNPKYVAGRVGQAMSFDGNDAINVLRRDGATDPGAGDFTIEGWLQIQSGAQPGLAALYTNYGGVQYHGLFVDNNRLSFGARDSAANHARVNGTTAIDDGNWHHFAAVRSGSTFSVYLDGVLDSTPVVLNVGAVAGSNSYIRIGATHTTTGHLTQSSSVEDFLNGKLDEVSFHKRALSLSELSQLVTDGNQGVGKSLPAAKAWYGMEGTFEDIAGVNEVTYVQSTPQFVPGSVGQAAEFNGTDALGITKQNQLFSPYYGDFTVEARIRIQPGAQPNGLSGTIFSDYAGVQYWGLWVTNQKLHFGARDASSNRVDVYGQQLLDDGQWHHVVGIRHGSEFRIAVDGRTDGTVVSPSVGSIDTSFANYLRIGGSHSSTNHWLTQTSIEHFFNGNIDEVKYHSRALTSLEARYLDPPSVTFQTGSVTPISANAYDGVVADFNKDGIPDLATPHETSPFVSFLLGLGNGTFATPVTYPTGSGGYGIKAADLDADGFLDLASVNANSNTVTVLWGTTLGRFLAPSVVSVGSYPDGLTIADFNADGRLDIITANFTGNSMSVVYGNGTRALSSALNVGAVGNGPDGPAHGDFNGDGVLDVAVANWYDGQIAILRGQIGAGFYPLATYATGANPVNPVTGDLNSDGKLDIVVNNWSSNSVSVLLGNGTGTFTVANYPVGSTPNLTRMSDINNDGFSDLLVANAVGDSISILLGTGSGTFVANSPAQFQVGDAPRDTLVADFDGNGTKDIAVPASLSSNVTILLNQAPATNRRPVANSDSVTTDYQIAVSFNVLSNDTDPDSQPLTAILFSAPAHGTVSISSVGAVTYTPNPGFAGTDSFKYTASDGLSGTVSDVSIAVIARPVANAGGPYSVSAGSAVVLSGSESHAIFGTIVSYEWDFDYDGSTFQTDATGPTPLLSIPSTAASTVRTIAVRVTDSAGSQNIATSTVAISAMRSELSLVATSAETRVNSNTSSVQQYPSLSMSGTGASVISWETGTPGTVDVDISSQRFDVHGNFVGSEFQNNDPATSERVRASTAIADDGRFIVGWQGWGADGQDWGINAKRYNADGTQFRSQFIASWNQTGSQSDIQVAIAPGGSTFVVLWDDSYQDGSGNGLYYRLFTWEGDTISTGRVNNVTGGNQGGSDVVMLADGSFVVAWTSQNVDGAGYAVVARRFSANGTPVDANEFQVNTITAGDQFGPALANLNGTGFLIAWASASDGSGGGAFAQRYDTQWNRVGSEFRINETTTGTQQDPSISVTSSGNAVISWSSLGQDGSGWSVYARALKLDTMEFGPETLVNSTTAGDQYSFGIRGAIATNPAGISTIVWNGNGVGDSSGIFRRQFAIAADQNQAPTLSLSPSSLSLAEDADTSSGITVSDLIVTDDAYGTETFSLSGLDAGYFEIVGTSLRLKPGVVLDFETKPTYTVTVSIDDPTVGGNPDDSETFTLGVTDVNEAPSVSLTPVITTLPESTPTSNPVTVATIQLFDDLQGANIVYLSGPDSSLFQISGGTLQLRAGAVLDHESWPLLNVIVNIDDAAVGGNPDGSASFQLAISDSDEWVIIEPDQRALPVYGGVGNNDHVQVVVSLTEALTPAVEAAFDAFQAHLDAGLSNTTFFLPVLNLSLLGFEHFDRLLSYGSFRGVYDNPIAGTNYSDTLTGTTGRDLIAGNGGNDSIFGLGGADIIIGASGDDTIDGGEGNDSYLYSGAANGFDTLIAGAGHDQAIAVSAGTVIGLNGYSNGVDEFVGLSDTIIRDTAYSKTLDFSNTVLTAIAEIDAAGGNDVVTASNLSPGIYRGGSGDDVLNAGSEAVTWKYSGASNGFDTLNNGIGVTTAIVESAGTVVGVNGYANGVDEFVGLSDTIIRDTAYSKTLDFSNTVLTGIAEIDAAGGNDVVTASSLSPGVYRGGAGDDILTAGSTAVTWKYSGASNGFDTLNNGTGVTTAVVESIGTVIGVNGYVSGVDEFVGLSDTIIRDTAYSKTLDFSNTVLTGIAEIDAAGGNDVVTASNLSPGVYRGGAGDDVLTAGSTAVKWKYSGASNGFDTLNNGSGVTLAVVESPGTVIGVNGYINGVDEFAGLGDTIIRDTAYSKTLDFSNTVLTGIAEIDAAGGNDVVTASNLSPSVYRGGAGDDILVAGSTAVTWKYSGTNNGFDTLNNGTGVTTAVVESAGTVIGVNGYVNGVDEFVGLGDTIIRDTAYSKTLDFSNTVLTGIAEVDAAGGNDVVTASVFSSAVYRLGAGDDTLIILNSGAAQVDVADFKQSGRDRIDLRSFGITNGLAGLTQTQSGADTVVSGPANLSLRLLDTLFSSLVDNDFLF